MIHAKLVPLDKEPTFRKEITHEINSEPSGAVVYANGKYVGKTPLGY